MLANGRCVGLCFCAERVPFDGGEFSLSSLMVILKGFFSLSTSRRDPLVYPRRVFTATGVATSGGGAIMLNEEVVGPYSTELPSLSAASE